jgi:hypothetical protein
MHAVADRSDAWLDRFDVNQMLDTYQAMTAALSRDAVAKLELKARKSAECPVDKSANAGWGGRIPTQILKLSKSLKTLVCKPQLHSFWYSELAHLPRPYYVGRSNSIGCSGGLPAKRLACDRHE